MDDDDEQGLAPGPTASGQGLASPYLTDEERGLVVTSLHRVLKPFILRRVKEDVAFELPPKVERTVACPLSGLQAFLYNNYRKASVLQQSGMGAGSESEWRLGKHGSDGDDSDGSGNGTDDDDSREDAGNIGTITKSDFSHPVGSTFRHGSLSYSNLIMQLRKLCNHPYLLLEDVLTIPDELYYQYIVSSSGKMCVLDRLLKRLLPQGHRVLIFCQMTTMMDILQVSQINDRARSTPVKFLLTQSNSYQSSQITPNRSHHGNKTHGFYLDLCRGICIIWVCRVPVLTETLPVRSERD